MRVKVIVSIIVLAVLGAYASVGAAGPPVDVPAVDARPVDVPAVDARPVDVPATDARPVERVAPRPDACRDLADLCADGGTFCRAHPELCRRIAQFCHSNPELCRVLIEFCKTHDLRCRELIAECLASPERCRHLILCLTHQDRCRDEPSDRPAPERDGRPDRPAIDHRGDRTDARPVVDTRRLTDSTAR